MHISRTRYGSSFGLSSPTCEGSCAAGYYCPVGSRAPTEVSCGDPSLYCPAGSAAPLKVPRGYYSTEAPSAEKAAGRELSDPIPEMTDGGIVAVDVRVAGPGWYAVEGVRHKCPAGTWGHSQVRRLFH